jgi:hypothetical protein
VANERLPARPHKADSAELKSLPTTPLVAPGNLGNLVPFRKRN